MKLRKALLATALASAAVVTLSAPASASIGGRFCSPTGGPSSSGSYMCLPGLDSDGVVRWRWY